MRSDLSPYDQYPELKVWGEQSFAQFSDEEAGFYAAEIGKPPSSTRPLDLLEIGYGNGSLLGWARVNKYKVVGYELQELLIDRAERAGFPVMNNIQDIGKESFDIIVALDVFEHIKFDDLVLLTTSIHTALRPGGRLIARFPNGDSPFSMPTFNGDHTHVNWMGGGKVKNLMKMSGFEQYILRAPFEPYQNLSGKIKWLVKSSLRKSFELFAKSAFLGGGGPSTFCLNYLLTGYKHPKSSGDDIEAVNPI